MRGSPIDFSIISTQSPKGERTQPKIKIFPESVIKIYVKHAAVTIRIFLSADRPRDSTLWKKEKKAEEKGSTHLCILRNLRGAPKLSCVVFYRKTPRNRRGCAIYARGGYVKRPGGAANDVVRLTCKIRECSCRSRVCTDSCRIRRCRPRNSAP